MKNVKNYIRIKTGGSFFKIMYKKITKLKNNNNSNDSDDDWNTKRENKELPISDKITFKDVFGDNEDYKVDVIFP